MTGTAMTEAGEFKDIYNLDVIAIPTNNPIKRVDEDDAIYRTAEEKYEAVFKEIEACHKRKQPILVGTISIEKSEFLPNLLDFGNFGFDRIHNFNNWNFNFDSADFGFGKWWLPIGITGLVQGALFLVNIVYTILAVIKTNEGETFQYPITIKFIK
jgi:hypothetical protein